MKKIFLLVLITVISLRGISQKYTNDHIWINLGTGADFTGNFAIGGSLTYQLQMFTLSARYINIPNSCLSCTEKNYSRDIGLLIGLIQRKEKGFISGGAGIGSFFYKEEKYGLLSNNIIEDSRYSIPIEIQAFLTRKNIGIGLYGFADFNSHKSFAGVLISLQIGFSPNK